MKQLSELLREAQQGAPPPRYGVEHMVAAGRRRVRRRNAGLAVAAAAVVALVIGAPQLLVRPDAQGPVLPVAPAPSASPARHVFTFPFRGYAVGDYTVTNPDSDRLGLVTAAVRRGGSLAGTLSLYPPGVRITDIFRAGVTETERINGRPAYRVDPGTGEPRLAWEAGGDRLAVAEPLVAVDTAVLRDIAARFALGGGDPARLAFRLGVVPPGYRLISVAGTGSIAHLVPSPAAEAVRNDPARSAGLGTTPGMLTVRLAAEGNAPLEPECTGGETPSCRMAAGRAGYLIEVRGEGVPASTVREVFDATLQADPADRSGWYPIDDAVPASARL